MNEKFEQGPIIWTLEPSPMPVQQQRVWHCHSAVHEHDLVPINARELVKKRNQVFA